MDLGIAGRNALVCASSRGLGFACAMELARAGCTVIVNGREGEPLKAAAAKILRETGTTVIPIVADVSDRGGQKALIAAVPQIDILINNNGGPPFRDYRTIDRAALVKGVTANMAAPIELV